MPDSDSENEAGDRALQQRDQGAFRAALEAFRIMHPEALEDETSDVVAEIIVYVSLVLEENLPWLAAGTPHCSRVFKMPVA